MKSLCMLFFLTFLFLSFTYGIEKNNQGLFISLKNNTETKIRIKVLQDGIVRVSAVPFGNFSERESLMIEQPEKPEMAYKWTYDDNEVIIITTALKIHIDRNTGKIIFKDQYNNIILEENNGGGKNFIPIEIERDKGYTIRQVFESPINEAFYGLGQHQADEFNYKGKNEVLFQYNTKVSVPFIVSNKNYGILWDNNSLTKFGDPRDYSQLSVFELYNKQGEKGNLTATYLHNNGKELFLERNENEIDYEDLEKVKNFPSGFKFNNSLIIWEGEIEAQESGIYRFLLYYAGYTKVFINNEEVVAERWRTAWNPNSYKFQYNFEKGKRYPIKIEWKPDGGISYLSLKTLTPVPDEEQQKLSFWSEMADMIDYYFIYGNNSDEVIKGYRYLTGKSQIMPKWAMGFWQSRERYKTQDELLSTVAEFRKRGIGLDNIVLDWSYWKEAEWGSHEFDPARFPNPKGMIDNVHAMNAKIMISVWPKFYHTTQHYKEFDEKGWMYTRAVKDSIRDWIGKGYIGSFYDAYSPGARKLFWKQMEEHLYSKGIDAWWMDASEPDILSNASLEYRKELSTPTYLGSSARYLNAYALVNAMAIYDGQRSVAPNKRVFLLTRSGFAGLQRYSTATWSGDIGTCWEDMKAQISAGLNFSISGIPYWTMDIGGFCVQKKFEKAKEGTEAMEEWRELNARWYQFGAFCPLFRSHGQYPYREIYNIASETHPTYQSMLTYNRLRYRLMPYIYTLASRTWFDDYTIMRPLVMDFNGDENIYDISDQYMFGDYIMACPVYEYKARNRKVYLPKQNGWYDFHTGKYLPGGQLLLVDAPYEQMPIYIKEGSIIPTGRDIQFTTQETDGAVHLYVYTGKDADFTLYEDEGENYNYEKGVYNKIPISYEEKSGRLKIGKRIGEFAGMQKERTFYITVISPQNPKIMDFESQPDKTIKYMGKNCTIKIK